MKIKISAAYRVRWSIVSAYERSAHGWDPNFLDIYYALAERTLDLPDVWGRILMDRRTADERITLDPFTEVRVSGWTYDFEVGLPVCHVIDTTTDLLCGTEEQMIAGEGLMREWADRLTAVDWNIISCGPTDHLADATSRKRERDERLRQYEERQKEIGSRIISAPPELPTQGLRRWLRGEL